MLDTAEEKHLSTLSRTWQIPMYNLDFSLIPVTLGELEAAQVEALTLFGLEARRLVNDQAGRIVAVGLFGSLLESRAVLDRRPQAWGYPLASRCQQSQLKVTIGSFFAKED